MAIRCPKCKYMMFYKKQSDTWECENHLGEEWKIVDGVFSKKGEKKKVPDMLRDAAQIYEQRNKVYGDNYKRFGAIMRMLFPNGLTLTTDDDFNRFGIFVQVVAKITRYAENFKRGGHNDSLDDAAVYAMMLRELDMEAQDDNEVSNI